MSRSKAAVSFIKRMMNMMLSRAWEQYQAWYREDCRQRYLVHGALNRMRHAALSRAWEKWQYNHQMYKDLMALLGNAAKKWRNRAILGGWNQWREWAEEHHSPHRRPEPSP